MSAASEAISATLDAEMLAAETVQPKAVVPAGPPVEVTVIGNYQVNHEGTTYGPGQTVTVPAALAEHWQLCGYVQLA